MHIKKLLSVITSAAVAVSLLAGCSLGRKKYSGLDITFLSAGKADAIVIATENHTVLLDAGESGMGKYIYDYCMRNERSSADYFIITHFDQDHCGGAKAVINKFESVGSIIQPDYEETNSEYRKYAEIIKEKDIVPQAVHEPVSFTLDEAVFTVYPPLEDKYSQTNNYSLALTVEYGKKAFLFTGDAEKARISELLKQIPERKDGYDLIKMPHHGKCSKNTGSLIEFAKPSLAVICCGSDKDIESETAQILSDANAQIFSTSKGDIVFSCDGYSIKESEQLIHG